MVKRPAEGPAPSVPQLREVRWDMAAVAHPSFGKTASNPKPELPVDKDNRVSEG